MRGRGDHGRRLSDAERSEIWARIAAGETHWETAEVVGCSTKSVQRLLAKTGELRSRTASRWSLRLPLCEREEISRGLQAGDSYRAIAGRLGRAPSTVSGEVAAHGSRSGSRAGRAERRGIQASRRPKVRSLSEALGCVRKSNGSSHSIGPRSRLFVVLRWITPSIRRCVCPTRRSTDRYSSKLVAACARS